MCGVIAAIGIPGAHLLNSFELLLSAGITRGKDSSGVAAITPTTIQIAKGCYLPLELMRHKSYATRIAATVDEAFCYIGHNRAATSGQVNHESSHPFKYRNITLVHNGTLVLDVVTEAKCKSDTDSETICVGIVEQGIDKVWETLDGSSALVYYNTDDQTLNIITNGLRPLFFVGAKKRNFMLVASETWMLFHVCHAARINTLKKDVCWKPGTNNLWSFKYDPRTQRISEEKRTLEVKPIKTWYERGRQSVLGGRGNLGGYTDSDWYLQGSEPQVPINTVIDLPLRNGTTITRADYDKQYHSCAACYCDIASSFNTAYILDNEIALCVTCATRRLAERIKENKRRASR